MSAADGRSQVRLPHMWQWQMVSCRCSSNKRGALPMCCNSSSDAAAGCCNGSSDAGAIVALTQYQAAAVSTGSERQAWAVPQNTCLQGDSDTCV